MEPLEPMPKQISPWETPLVEVGVYLDLFYSDLVRYREGVELLVAAIVDLLHLTPSSSQSSGSSFPGPSRVSL